MLDFDMGLRGSGASDAGFIYDVYDATARPMVERASRRWAESRMREKCWQDAMDPDMRIVQASGVDCGFFCLKVGPDDLFIDSLFLLPQYQCRGIGKQLLSQVHATSDAARLPVRLWVMHFNPDARVYYESQGYVVTSEGAQWHCMERRPQPMPVGTAFGHGGVRD